MKTMKRLVAIALSVLMIFGSLSMIANAWDANVDDGKTLSITTKIFRLVDGKWTETEKVKQGEEVRARIYLNTDYYTNTGNLLFFYNNDFFEDSFGEGHNDIVVNSYYSGLPYGITGTFVGDDSTSDVENFMISNGKITADFANKHNFVYISYNFESGANNQKLSDSQWLFEIPLTVREDAADGTGKGDFFAVEETTRSTSFKKGRMNVPKGPYDGVSATITSMANWDAVLDYESQPVTIYDNFVTASFDAGFGEFADKTTVFKAEGDAGDALTVPNPTRSNYKFMGWKLKGADDSTAAQITEFPAEVSEYEAVWKSTTETGEELTFITKIYRLDPETNEWIYTDRVRPGEKVKARLFVDTSYFTNAGNIIMFYDSEFFTDSYEYNVKNDLVPNESKTSSAYVNRVNGDFAKIDGTNYSLQDLVTYNYITQDFADTHTAITARYQFNPSTSKKISGDEWFIEFDLEVLDTASGKGEFFVVEDTIKNSGDGVYAYINIPLGTEGGSKEETTSMHLWDVIPTVKSYPVYTESKITLDANGGNFGTAGESTYVIEGSIGDAVDYTAVPEAVREGYTFKGWVDASVENPTAADIVDLPAEMPYKDSEYKAFWTNNVEITFVIGDSEIKRVVTAGDPFEAPEDPESEGALFIGWSTDKTSGTISNLPDKYPAEDEVYYAIFESKTYKVTYYVLNPVTNRFEIVNSGSVVYGDTIVTVPGSYVAPEGYALSKAYADVGLTKEFAAGQKMPAAEVNIYYYLEEVIYDAVFMVDGIEYDRIPVMYGSEITPPEAPTKAGYDFVGWDPYVGTMDEAGMVFEAVWTPAEYTVTWVVEGETYDEFDIIYGEDMEIPAEPDVTGYDFIGWSEDENATEAGQVAAKMPANDVTYYAVLKAKQYTISFTETGDSVIAPITQDYKTPVTAPADPVKEGHKFEGWDDEIPTTMPAYNMTIKAIWSVVSYDVTWDVDGKETTEKVEFGAEIVAPTDPEKEGYTFAGWSPDVPATMPADDVVIKATWTVNENNVTYINEGTVYDGPTAVKYGDDIPVPTEPIKAGYKFDGWFDKDGKQPADYNSMPDNALEFTAKWTANSNVSYVFEVYEMDIEGAYPAEATETVTYTDGVVDTTKTVEYAVPKGFTLDEASSSLTGKVPATGTLVLKAYLIRNTYKLNVVVEGETATEEYYYNEAVAPVANPVKDGFVFKYWTDAEGNEVSIPSIMPANDVTVYAKFTEGEFEAKFDAVDGKFESTDSPIYSTDVTFGQDIVPPTEKPVKEGYEFGGWATPDDPETPVTDFGQMGKDGAEFIAIWNKTDFTVTFYDYKPAEGGPISPDVIYSYATLTKQMGESVAILGDPGTFEHYEFLGWSTVEGDAENIVTEAVTMPSRDLALYAIYAPVKVMLIPKNDTCSTVIDRAGGDVDDYNAETSRWYVYGIKEYIKAPELLENYIDVSGDGRIELIHAENGLGGTWEYTGTGTVINVYNRMGTPDDISDDILVESFHIIIFGDINGDSVVQAIDATYVYDEAAGLTSWANPGSGKYVHYLAKAANVDNNTYVDAIDATYIGDHSIGIVRIDQVTGKLK